MTRDQLLAKYAKALNKAVDDLTPVEIVAALEGTEWAVKADLSLDEQAQQVRNAWRAAYPIEPTQVRSNDSWVCEIYDDHVIVDEGGEYYQVAFTRAGDDFTFAPRSEWKEVERKTEWIAKSIQMQVIEGHRNPLKSISVTPDEIRMGNYIVLYGDENHRDLEFLRSGPNPDGSLGEFFTKSTKLDSIYTKSGVLPIDWEHGEAPDPGGPPQDELLGYVDWKTAVSDSVGVFVQRVLKRAGKYAEALQILLDAGILTNSSAAIPERVVVKNTGEIVSWPLRADTLTVMPCEPRMMTQNVMHAIKTLTEAHVQPKVEPDGANTPATTAKTAPLQTTSKAGTKTGREIRMNKEFFLKKAAKALGKEVSQLTSAEYAAALEGTEWEGETPPVQMVPLDAVKAIATEAAVEATKVALKAVGGQLPANNGAPGTATIDVTLDEGDQPFAHDGEFFMAVKSAAIDPANIDKRLVKYRVTERAEKAGQGMNEAVPSEGGFLVPGNVKDGILERAYSTGEILKRVSTDPVSVGNSMTYNAVDETSRANGSRNGGLLSYWVAEGGSIPKSKPLFDQIELKLKKVAALVYATDEQLQDVANLRSWLNRTVPNEIRFRVEDAYFEGDGVGKPLGFFNGPCMVSFARENANAITTQDILKMWARRWAGVSDYVWLINQDAVPQLGLLTLGNQPLYMPAGGISAAPFGSLQGKPVIETEYNPSLGSKGDIILASLSQYQAITKGDVQQASSIHVAFLTDEEVFRFITRTDGAPMWKSALTPFKGTNTQSPFVSLNASS